MIGRSWPAGFAAMALMVSVANAKAPWPPPLAPAAERIDEIFVDKS